MAGLLSLKWNNHSTAFLQSIDKIHLKEKYCDATIVCQGKYFPVHRIVLSTCSLYFEEMFETINSQHPYIVFKDINPREMELMLNYMYKGEINVEQKMLPTLVAAAESLKLKGIAVPDDFPSSKNLNDRKRTNTTDNNSILKRRSEEVKRTNVNRSRISSTYSGLSNLHSSDESIGVHPFEGSTTDAKPVFIKEEPVDVLDYNLSEIASNYNATLSESTKESYAASLNLSSKPESIFCTTEDLVENDKQISLLTRNDSNSIPHMSSQDNFNEQDNISEFAIEDGLDEHNFGIRNNPRMPTSGKMTTPGVTSSLTFFNCSFCNYRSPRRADVQKHNMFKHTKERPYPCTMCSKRFTEKIALKRHMRVHTGEKPFQCPNCAKRFGHKVNLTYHMRMNKCKALKMS